MWSIDFRKSVRQEAKRNPPDVGWYFAQQLRTTTARLKPYKSHPNQSHAVSFWKSFLKIDTSILALLILKWIFYFNFHFTSPPAQPPGVPEICKKSLTCCSASGGKELFILGKNFLKDTHIVFQTDEWEQSVNPDKEFLQQVGYTFFFPKYFSNIFIKVRTTYLEKIT